MSASFLTVGDSGVANLQYSLSLCRTSPVSGMMTATTSGHTYTINSKAVLKTGLTAIAY